MTKPRQTTHQFWAKGCKLFGLKAERTSIARCHEDSKRIGAFLSLSIGATCGVYTICMWESGKIGGQGRVGPYTHIYIYIFICTLLDTRKWTAFSETFIFCCVFVGIEMFEKPLQNHCFLSVFRFGIDSFLNELCPAPRSPSHVPRPPEWSGEASVTNV